MRISDILNLAFLKIAAELEEQDPVEELKTRAKKFAGSNKPKGLPSWGQNYDGTDPNYVLEKDLPRDQGWSKTISGSGSGPEL